MSHANLGTRAAARGPGGEQVLTGRRPALADATASSAVAARPPAPPRGPAVPLPPWSDPTVPEPAQVSERLRESSLVRDVLILVAERAVDVLQADVAAVAVADSAGLTVEVVAGHPPADLCGRTVPRGSWRFDQVLSPGSSVVVADLRSVLHPSLVALAYIGPCLVVPLWGRVQPYGVLIAGRHRGAPPFPAEAVSHLRGVPPAPPRRRADGASSCAWRS